MGVPVSGALARPRAARPSPARSSPSCAIPASPTGSPPSAIPSAISPRSSRARSSSRASSRARRAPVGRRRPGLDPARRDAVLVAARVGPSAAIDARRAASARSSASFDSTMLLERVRVHVHGASPRSPRRRRERRAPCREPRADGGAPLLGREQHDLEGRRPARRASASAPRPARAARPRSGRPAGTRIRTRQPPPGRRSTSGAATAPSSRCTASVTRICSRTRSARRRWCRPVSQNITRTAERQERHHQGL